MKETPVRPYIITEKSTQKKRLVVAANPAQAIRHVARETFDASAASALEVAKMMGGGATLETARSDPDPEPVTE